MKKSCAAETYAQLSPLITLVSAGAGMMIGVQIANVDTGPAVIAWIIGGIAVAVGLPVLGHWIVFRLEQAAREKTLNE